MDRSRHQILPRPGLAQQQHRRQLARGSRFKVSNPFDQLDDLRDPGGHADDLAVGRLLDLFALKVREAFSQAMGLQRLFDHEAELVVIDRLLDVVVCPVLHSGHSALDAAVRSHDDDDDAPIEVQDPPQRVEPTHTGQLDIQQDQIGPILLDRCHPFLCARQTPALMAISAEGVRHRASEYDLVINDQYLSHLT